MKVLSKFALSFSILGIIYILSTGISLNTIDGIKDGVITGSFGNNSIFEIINRAKYITIGTNSVGLLIIAFLWLKSFQESNDNK